MGRSSRELTLADKAVRFINNLTLTGDFTGKRFKLRPWQEQFVRRLFEPREDGTRQYNRAFLGLPRKQGKTELIAAIVLFLLICGPAGQEIYSASGDRSQASLIFKRAAAMVAADPKLSQLCTVYHGLGRREIVCDKSGNSFQALSSDAPTKHGLNPSAVIFDEVHILPNRDLHEVLTSAMGARRDPLTVYITTAGKSRHSLCYELWTYAERVAKGTVNDPRFLPVIYAADDDDDWTDEVVWHKAMPALGDFCRLEYIREKCEQAKVIPAEENAFRQLYLNQWLEARVDRWLRVGSWNACEAPITLDDFAGEEAVLGLDLATIHDLAALAILIPGDHPSLLMRFWAPRDSVRRREETDGVPYSAWARGGHLTLTDGEAIDYGVIERDILAIAEKVKVRRLGSDPWNFNSLGHRLMEAGLDVVKYGQGFAYMNAPAKEFERLILSGEMRHDGNPVMAWCVENTVIDRDRNENIRPSKGKSTEKIDGVVAAVTAIGSAMAAEIETEAPSVYSNRGIMVI